MELPCNLTLPVVSDFRLTNVLIAVGNIGIAMSDCSGLGPTSQKQNLL